MWLASMSKLLGATALMMLAEDGKLDVTDPVSAYIPEFATPGRVRVLRPGSPPPVPAMPFGPPPDPLPVYDEVPAERELTLFDLLTHTGGLQSIFAWNPEYVPPAPGDTLAGYVSGLASVVRDFQPGKGWAYSNAASYDVLSRVIEIASGRPLDTYLSERIFQSLGTRSFGFGRGGEPGAAPLPAAFAGNPVIAGQTYRATSAGLWATAEDYLTFAEILRNDGAGMLSPASVGRMTTNQIADLCPGLNGREPAPGIGIGLGGVATIEDPTAAGESLPTGAFGWDGVGTRRFWVSREHHWSLFMYAPDQTTQREIEAATARILA